MYFEKFTIRTSFRVQGLIYIYIYINVIYLCDQSCIFSIITPVFSHMIFRNHYKSYFFQTICFTLCCPHIFYTSTVYYFLCLQFFLWRMAYEDLDNIVLFCSFWSISLYVMFSGRWNNAVQFTKINKTYKLRGKWTGIWLKAHTSLFV